MYKNSFYYQGVYLGSSLTNHEDPFKALAAGRDKAQQIAKALRVKLPLIKQGDIEIHSDPYNPQYDMLPELLKVEPPMEVVPGQVTLRNLKPGPLAEEKSE